MLAGGTVLSVQRYSNGVEVRLNDGRIVNDTQIMQIGAKQAELASGA